MTQTCLDGDIDPQRAVVAGDDRVVIQVAASQTELQRRAHKNSINGTLLLIPDIGGWASAAVFGCNSLAENPSKFSGQGSRADIGVEVPSEDDVVAGFKPLVEQREKVLIKGVQRVPSILFARQTANLLAMDREG
jgi:hypothetical protein